MEESCRDGVFWILLCIGAVIMLSCLTPAAFIWFTMFHISATVFYGYSHPVYTKRYLNKKNLGEKNAIR